MVSPRKQNESERKDGSGGRCPTCGGELEKDARHAPFCSERCRLADLHGWFSGKFRLGRPIQPDEDVEGLPREQEGEEG